MSYSKNRVKYLQIYPDGIYIAMVRHPVSWLTSAKRYPVYRNLSYKQKMQSWERTVEGALGAKVMYPDNVMVFSLETLLENTKEVMQRICERLWLEFEQILLVPTFNCKPVESTSYFKESELGVMDKRVLTRELKLTDDEEAYLNDVSSPLYERILPFSETV